MAIKPAKHDRTAHKRCKHGTPLIEEHNERPLLEQNLFAPRLARLQQEALVPAAIGGVQGSKSAAAPDWPATPDVDCGDLQLILFFHLDFNTPR